MDAEDTSTEDVDASIVTAAPDEPQKPEPVMGNEPGETWSPPQFEAETGIAIDGEGLPVNHRLRAERLASLGKDEDPAGEISAELIADAKERLAAATEARPPVNANMKVADIEAIAAAEGVDLSSAANNAERVALIEAARNGGNA